MNTKPKLGFHREYSNQWVTMYSNDYGKTYDVHINSSWERIRVRTGFQDARQAMVDKTAELKAAGNPAAWRRALTAATQAQRRGL
jgi:hypothetical protein